VPADKAEALRLFQLAVEQGEERARREVERLAAPVKKSKIKFVDRTVPGRHFGLVGIGGVTPPKKETPDEKRNQCEDGSGDRV
jgi:hypothetical protein